jgi:hypothetical protein
MIRQPDLIVDTRQGQSYLLKGKLKDETGNTVPGSIIQSLTLTLRDRDSGDIINTRHDQNCLQLNGVTVAEDGTFRWLVSAADNAVLHVTRGVEVHLATFTITWSLGDKVARPVIQLNTEVIED